jgi:hypothetical protein
VRVRAHAIRARQAFSFGGRFSFGGGLIAHRSYACRSEQLGTNGTGEHWLRQEKLRVECAGKSMEVGIFDAPAIFRASGYLIHNGGADRSVLRLTPWTTTSVSQS